MTTATLIVCKRVSDLAEPHVPSTTARCADCQARIWLAEGGPHLVPVCERCVHLAERADAAA